MSERLGYVLERHLHPRNGSPYWLERERELGYSLVSRFTGIDDLDQLGPFDLESLARRPVTDFVPRDVLASGPLILGETGGTTGVPKTVAYDAADFHAAFVAPLLESVDGAQLFRGGYWLWLGPSGPHVIGKAAQAIARLTTGCDAFSVDFDPRWFRRLAPQSRARGRYLDHVIEQAVRIVAQQDVRYLFTTPVVLEALTARMHERQRSAVRFVYLGGMAIDGPGLARLAAELPHAQFLCGYGNTLFGVCHEARPARPCGAPRRYYPPGERLVVRVSAGAEATRPCAYGERGQVVMYRLDPSGLLPVVRERDHAVRAAPLPGSSRDGFADPRPPADANFHVDHGIY